MNFSRRNFSIFFIIVSITFAPLSLAREYELLRAPQSSMIKLSKAWKPFLVKLKKETGISLKLKLFNKRQQFEQYLSTGQYDFLFANPYYSLLVKDKLGYEAIVRSDAKRLKGIIVVSADSTITINNLHNKTVAFPGRNALAASLLVRSILARQGITIAPIYTQSHQNTYLSVLNKSSVAGGGIKRTFNEFKAKEQLKIIFKTPGLAMHPLSIHSRVPEKDKLKILSFIFKLQKTVAGRKILKKIRLAKPVAVDFIRDYKILRDLKLEKFSTIQL
ncbi:ABC transporter, substrate-binding protein (cluster 12, methionine/phosphonates) [hydrothermal vent metagenome]|uniref:ABC transporter, substrate-binding protein (Cluster 12, methionine/phosphonates) n=1 Tax=hydrothermal vent metagenome TaxID=652676 RepID=A0A3B0Z175_9ZZZZ